MSDNNWKKKYLLIFSRFGVSIFLLYILLTRIPFENILGIIAKSNFGLIIVAQILVIGVLTISVLRWQRLLKYIGYDYRFQVLLKLIFITFFFNVYAPGGVVGEIVRVMILTKENDAGGIKINYSKVSASVVTDRLIGFIGLVFIGSIGVLLNSNPLEGANLYLMFSIISFGLILLFVLLFSKRFQNFLKKFSNLIPEQLKFRTQVLSKIKKVLNVFSVYRTNYFALVSAFLFSIFIHLITIIAIYLLAIAINLNITFVNLLTFIPIINIVSSIPISFGGVGIREFSTILLFSNVGVAEILAISLSLLYYANLLFTGLLGGGVYMIHALKKHG